MIDAELAALDFCYVTTTGRTTGKPHRIEIWFAAHPDARHDLHALGWTRPRRLGAQHRRVAALHGRDRRHARSSATRA